VLEDALVRALARGPQGGPALQEQLGVSKSTLQRALHQAREQLCVVGRARATRYALRRPVEGVRTPLPVYELDPEGQVRHALTLHPVEPFGYFVEGHVPEVTSGFQSIDPRDPELPWFLLDTRPHGFLGRAWAAAHKDQGFPRQLERWTADQVLRFWASYGIDLVGAFVVGDVARTWMEQVAPAPADPSDYPKRAIQALTEAPGGSSPGGEQPKFAVTGRLVKFSPRLTEPSGQRWADLLAIEHLTHTLLREHGIDAALSVVLDDDNRRFLEIHRFDRHGERGRSGLVSLAALDASGVAQELRSWTLGTAPLVAQGMLAPEVHDKVSWLEAFGHLIANTDMHPGNVSFHMRGTTVLGLAPVYDMLPMAFAPRHGHLPEEIYRPTTQRDHFPASALALARALWERVLDSQLVSAAFKDIAERQRQALPR
jgi:hypothetical protein